MDNYLNHRWPQGSGVQPPPLPGPATPPAEKPRRRPFRRWLITAVCIVLSLALLVSVSFWAVNGLASILVGSAPFISGDSPFASALPSGNLSGGGHTDWSLEDLPWGEPDPSVQLTTVPAAGTILSGRDIHEKVLPSIVYVRAVEKGSMGLAAFSGTGIIVTGSGYVLTNFHIVEDSDRVQVMLLDNQAVYYDARVIGVDEKFDMAVLKFDGEGLGLTPAQLGDSDTLAVGDKVYAEGNPMGHLPGSMTEGIVSALDRDNSATGDGLAMIQTSAALNPGNSGGALVNELGQVVGITSAKITGLVREDGEPVEKAAVIENIGLAIPISDILPFVNRMIATGKSWRPSIGVTCKEAVMDGWHGIQIATVDEGVPARAAGLRPGDLIVSANGVQVETLAQLRRVLYRTGVDGLLNCVAVRNGAEVSLTFPLIDKLDEQE